MNDPWGVIPSEAKEHMPYSFLDEKLVEEARDRDRSSNVYRAGDLLDLLTFSVLKGQAEDGRLLWATK